MGTASQMSMFGKESLETSTCYFFQLTLKNVARTARRLLLLFHFHMWASNSSSQEKEKKLTFSISSAVLPLAPSWTMLRETEMLSGEKTIFSFLFTLLSSLKKSRQKLAFAALREPIVGWPSPTTGQLCNPSHKHCHGQTTKCGESWKCRAFLRKLNTPSTHSLHRVGFRPHLALHRKVHPTLWHEQPPLSKWPFWAHPCSSPIWSH